MQLEQKLMLLQLQLSRVATLRHVQILQINKLLNEAEVHLPAVEHLQLSYISVERNDLQLVAVLEHDLLEVRLQAQVRLAALELVHLEQDRALGVSVARSVNIEYISAPFSSLSLKLR